MSSSPEIHPRPLSGDLPAWIRLPGEQLPWEVWALLKVDVRLWLHSEKSEASAGEKGTAQGQGVLQASCCGFKERSPTAVALRGGSEVLLGQRAGRGFRVTWQLNLTSKTKLLHFSWFPHIWKKCTLLRFHQRRNTVLPFLVFFLDAMLRLLREAL